MSAERICPGCGSKYKFADNLGGKKIRCKKCQQVFVTSAPIDAEPAPSAGRSSARKKTERGDGAARQKVKRGGPYALPPPEVGDRFGNYSVVSCDGDHLFIRSRSFWPIIIGLTGVLALAFCILLVWGVVSALLAGESLTLRWRSLVGLVMLLGYGASTIFVMALAAGIRLRFDGPSRTIEEWLFYGLYRKTYSLDKLMEVQFLVKPPDEHKREWCAVVLPTDDQDEPREIGSELADDDGAVRLLHAGQHLARLFGVPLRLVGHPRKHRPKLAEALEGVATGES